MTKKKEGALPEVHAWPRAATLVPPVALYIWAHCTRSVDEGTVRHIQGGWIVYRLGVEDLTKKTAAISVFFLNAERFETEQLRDYLPDATILSRMQVTPSYFRDVAKTHTDLKTIVKKKKTQPPEM